jgi:hypothetical protein
MWSALQEAAVATTVTTRHSRAVQTTVARRRELVRNTAALHFQSAVQTAPHSGLQPRNPHLVHSDKSKQSQNRHAARTPRASTTHTARPICKMTTLNGSRIPPTTRHHYRHRCDGPHSTRTAECRSQSVGPRGRSGLSRRNLIRAIATRAPLHSHRVPQELRRRESPPGRSSRKFGRSHWYAEPTFCTSSQNAWPRDDISSNEPAAGPSSSGIRRRGAA